LFPEEIGTPPSEREAEPEVSPDPNAHVCPLTADAVRDAAQGGLEAAVISQELADEVGELKTLLQQLVDDQRRILVAMGGQANTYTAIVQHG
jgi:hypothetical protein